MCNGFPIFFFLVFLIRVNGREQLTSKWKWVSDRSVCQSVDKFPRNPAFLLIGAEKSGTTSLYEYLGQHQSIRLAAKSKEPYSLVHVLIDGAFNVSLSQYHYAKGQGDASGGLAGEMSGLQVALATQSSLSLKNAEAAFYEYVERAFGHVPMMRSGEITFEASPRYYTYPEMAAPLSQIAPCMRIIMTLREPLRRAESQYWHDICTPGYQNRLKVTNPFIGGSTSIRANECRPYAGTPPGFVSLLQVLKMEIDLWQRCTAAHGQVPVSLSSDADVASKEATKRRIRVLWNCLCTPLLVNRTAFSKRRVYFGYLVPGLYALPLERWLDVYPRDFLLFLNFDDWTAKQIGFEALNRRTFDFLGLQQLMTRKLASPQKLMAAPCFSKSSMYRKLGQRGGIVNGEAGDEQIGNEQAFLVDVYRDILRPANSLLGDMIGESWGWM